MRTVVTHFYNEEYMLPWWLMHHKKNFDHGIMIDYDSTDRSLEIIKEYCPTWTIVTSRNRQFDARKCDEEVMYYESQTDGWKICLNVTEFIVGDFSILNDIPNQVLTIPNYIMVDTDKDNNGKLSYNESLITQKPYGMPFDSSRPITTERLGRIIHNTKNFQYTTGRHYHDITNRSLKVLWYGYSPMTERMLQRKLQIQNRIPDSDKAQNLGHHHFTNNSEQMAKYNRYLPFSVDLSDELNLKNA